MRISVNPAEEDKEELIDIPVLYDNGGNPQESVIKILNVGDEIGEASILKNYKRLRRITESINFLKSIPCFQDLTNKRIKTLIESSKVLVDHKRNSYIIKEGMPVQYVYIVVAGELKVTKKIYET